MDSRIRSLNDIGDLQERKVSNQPLYSETVRQNTEEGQSWFCATFPFFGLIESEILKSYRVSWALALSGDTP